MRTQSAVKRIAFPLVPEPGSSPRDIGAVAPLEHNALDRDVARIEAKIFKFLERFDGDQLREIKASIVEPFRKFFEPFAPIFPSEPAKIGMIFEKDIVHAHERRDTRTASCCSLSFGRAVAEAH